MMPSRGKVKERFQALLDDPAGEVFDEAVFGSAFEEAFDVLYHAFQQYQVPQIEMLAYYTVAPGQVALTPSDMGISDMGDFLYLAERPASQSGTQFRQLQPIDRIFQQHSADRLGEFNYRNGTFYFHSLTQPVTLEIKYASSGTAPASDGTLILVDGALTFLSNYAVGVAGPRKGYDETAQRAKMQAVGPRFDMDQIGGELFRLIQTRVRSRQKEGPLAPRYYSAGSGGRRRLPRVPASSGAISGGGIDTPPAGTVSFTVPTTFSAATTFAAPNLITIGTGWATWAPIVAAAGSMTIAGLTVNSAEYLRFGPLCFFKLYATMTLGGTAANMVGFSLPIPVAGGVVNTAPAQFFQTATKWAPAYCVLDYASNAARVSPPNEVNFQLGQAIFLIEGFFRCA